MKSWKKLWKQELDNTIPALREDIKNAPLPAEESLSAGGAAVKVKRIAAGTAAAIFALAFCLIVFCIVWLAPEKNADPFVFTIEINPAVTLSTDAGGKVTGVMSSNADADVVLAAAETEEELLGGDIADFVTWYTDTAAMLGYLDVTAQSSAVRISAGESEGSESLLNGVKSALENYFIQKGVYAVVVGETVGAEEFKARSGITYGTTVKDFAAYIAACRTFYGDREAAGLTAEELRSAYEYKVVDGTLYKIIEKSLAENAAKIEQNAEDIQKLWALYGQIMSSPQNPATYPRDYWTVKKYYADKLDGRDEFRLLMAEMEEALADYENDYGVEITDEETLRKASALHENYAAQLHEILANLSRESFEYYYGDICGLLGAAGVDTDYFSALKETPETVEDYYKKLAQAMKAEYGYRKQEYAQSYEENRSELSDYDEYVNGIVAQYGSLSAYWKDLKGK